MRYNYPPAQLAVEHASDAKQNVHLQPVSFFKKRKEKKYR